CVFHRYFKHLHIDGRSIWQCRHLSNLLPYGDFTAASSEKRVSLLFHNEKRMEFWNHHIAAPLFPCAPGTEQGPVWKSLPMLILTYPTLCLQTDLFIMKTVELR